MCKKKLTYFLFFLEVWRAFADFEFSAEGKEATNHAYAENCCRYSDVSKKQHKILHIANTNAIVDPWAMMVHLY